MICLHRTKLSVTHILYLIDNNYSSTTLQQYTRVIQANVREIQADKREIRADKCEIRADHTCESEIKWTKVRLSR